jgi:aspartate aminotransferase
VAVVNGLSKSFAMSGWRLGYTLAHPDLVKQMSKIQGQSSSNVCSIAQKAALAALTGSWEPVQKMRESFARRRDLALSYIEGWSAVTCAVPDGAFYLFPKVSACYTEDFPDSTALCAHLLEEAGVALVPGAAFGEDEYIRFSYAVSDQNLEKALTAIGQVLS